MFEIEKGKYKQMMFKKVVKNYKKAPPDLEKELNSEAKMLAQRLGIVNREENTIPRIVSLRSRTTKVISRLILNVGLLTRPRHR